MTESQHKRIKLLISKLGQSSLVSSHAYEALEQVLKYKKDNAKKVGDVVGIRLGEQLILRLVENQKIVKQVKMRF
jgi:hypothetical protein